MNQGENIKREIIFLINNGMKNKSEIYTNITQVLKVPRPTVRRAARDLILDLEFKIKVLKGETIDKRI